MAQRTGPDLGSGALKRWNHYPTPGGRRNAPMIPTDNVSFDLKSSFPFWAIHHVLIKELLTIKNVFSRSSLTPHQCSKCQNASINNPFSASKQRATRQATQKEAHIIPPTLPRLFISSSRLRLPSASSLPHSPTSVLALLYPHHRHHYLHNLPPPKRPLHLLRRRPLPPHHRLPRSSKPHLPHHIHLPTRKPLSQL
jgi:hypothetical protein